MTVDSNVDKVFRTSNRSCQFSNNGAYLAVAFQTNLLAKDTKTFDTQSFVFTNVMQVNLYQLLIHANTCVNNRSYRSEGTASSWMRFSYFLRF